MKRLILYVAAGLLIPTLIAGDCVRVDSDRIFGSDLARAVPAFHGIDPGAMIGYAPVPGRQRVFTAGQLKYYLRRFGLPEAAVTSTCFERVTEPITEAALREAMVAALGAPDVEIEIVDFSRQPVPPGEILFTKAGLRPPPSPTPESEVLWRGSVRYGGRRSMPVWARVRLAVEVPRVIALRNLPARQPIPPDAVELRIMKVFPTSSRSVQLDELVEGSQPRRSIRAGDPILASDLLIPNDIEKGDVVQVEVRSGGARLAFEAEAESAGRRGQRISIRNPASGRKFQATVSGRGAVVLEVGLSCGRSR